MLCNGYIASPHCSLRLTHLFNKLYERQKTTNMLEPVHSIPRVIDTHEELKHRPFTIYRTFNCNRWIIFVPLSPPPSSVGHIVCQTHVFMDRRLISTTAILLRCEINHKYYIFVSLSTGDVYKSFDVDLSEFEETTLFSFFSARAS
jgi:hypothetical protein